MSVREWSLRMGLFTNEEDEEGIWNERMFGPPKNTPGFTPQSAWEAITHRKSGVFKTCASKGFHIINHLLRFVQVFIGYNLISHDNYTPTVRSAGNIHLSGLIIYPCDHACRGSASLSTTAMDPQHAEEVPPVSTTATDPQHAEEVEYTLDEVLEAPERAEKESEVEHDAGEDVIAEENVGDEEKIAEEDDNTGKDLDTAKEVNLNMTAHGGACGKLDITIAEGETSVKNAEGETPGSVVSGRETLANVEEGDPVEDVVKGETPVKIVSEGEAPVLEDEGETPGKVVEGETPDIAEEATSGGLQEIVDLVNEPEGDETPLDERLVRRRTRRSILDEVDEPTGAGELNLDVPEESEAEPRCLAIERKRKGKQEARILPKKPKKNPTAEPTEKLMKDAIKVPFAKASGSLAFESETEEKSE